MTGPEALKAIKRLGLSQARFARLVRLHANTVNKWQHGKQPYGPAVVLLELLMHRPEMLNVIENELNEKFKRKKVRR